MVVDVLDAKKRVEIWLTNNEKDSPDIQQKLKALCSEYSEMKYFVAVFRSGKGDLFRNTEALILHNRMQNCL